LQVLKKLLLLGQGQIGSALAEDLSEFPVHRWTGDLDDLSRTEIARIAPDVIINAAGKTGLEWCERNAREAVRSNLEAPVRLYGRIREAAPEARFIHFSSGCVWDGPYREDGNAFTPDVPPTPACLYSWTKAAADAMLLDLDPAHIAILRPRQVYSSHRHPRNMLAKLQTYASLIDTPNSVSSIEVIAKTVRYLLNAEASMVNSGASMVNPEGWTGVWNVYDRGTITPFEIGELLWNAGLRGRPERISKAALDAFHKPKRVDTVLFDRRFERAVQPEEVHTVLARTIAAWKESPALVTHD